MHSANDAYFAKLLDHISAIDQEPVIRYMRIFIDAIAQEEIAQQTVNCCFDE
jgi:hypothetical protein